MRGFVLVLFGVLILSGSAYAANNQWDDSQEAANQKYDSPGAFTVVGDSNYTIWDTATNIWSIRTPEVNNAIGFPPDNPGDANNPRQLGNLRILNQVDTVVTITNSFDGFVEVLFLDNGTYTNGSTIRFISLDEGATVVGANANANNPAIRDNAKAGFLVNGAEYQDTVILEEGHYVGKNIQAGGVILDLDQLYIYGTKFEGGGPLGNLNANANDRNGQGGDGLTLGSSTTNGIHSTVISNRLVEADAIRGGDGAERVQQNTANSIVSAYGGKGLLVDSPNNGVDTIDIQSLLAYGGNGGLVDFATGAGDIVNVDGGTAVNINDMTISISNGAFYGGNAGQVNNSTDAASVDASGGHGLQIGGNSTLTYLGPVYASGGNGGYVSNSVDTAGSVNAAGGHGVWVDGQLNFSSINNLSAIGGDGGDVTASGSSPVDVSGGDGFKFDGTAPDLVLNNIFIAGGDGGTGSGDAAVNADGGYGWLLANYDLTVTNGTFIGGDGGIAIGNSSSTALGGNALDVSASTLKLYNVDLFGGQGGTANGTAEADGYALSMYDSNLTVSNGTFSGRGLLSTSKFRSRIGGAVNIQDSVFSRAEFDGTGTHTIDVSDSAFSAIVLGGTSVLGINNLTASNSTFDSVILEGRATHNAVFEGSTIGTINKEDVGTSNIKTTSIKLDANTTISGRIYQNGGVLNFNQWNDSQLNNVLIDSGTMNFVAGDYSIGSGQQFVLGGAASVAKFAGDVTVENSGVLDVGLGAFTASSFTAEAGAGLATEVGSTTSGIILGDNITLNTGLFWLLYGSPTTISNTYLLASATGNLLSFLTTSDFAPNPANWLSGVNNVYTNGNNLYVDYGSLGLVDVFGGTGEFGKAMQELDNLMTPEMLGALNSGFNSAGAAGSVLNSVYVQTPEVANTMIQLQQSLAWQQYERFTTFRRYNNWANHPDSLRPQGSRGPDGMFGSAQDWFDEHLPLKDWFGASKDWADSTLPNADVMDSVKSWSQDHLPQVDLKKYVDAIPGAEGFKGTRATDIGDRLPQPDITGAVRSWSEGTLPDEGVLEAVRIWSETHLPDVDLPAVVDDWSDTHLPQVDLTPANVDSDRNHATVSAPKAPRAVDMDDSLPHTDLANAIRSWSEDHLPDVEFLAFLKSWSDDHLPGQASAQAIADSIPEDMDVMEEISNLGKSAPEPRFLGSIKTWLDDVLPQKEDVEFDIPKTYQTWGRVYGQTIRQDPDKSFDGYRSFVGGGTVGFDKSFDNLLAGIGGGFAQSTVSGDGDNDAEATSGYGSLYATASGERTYLDLSVTYALNDIETKSDPILGYEGDFLANTLNFYAGAGVGFPLFNDRVLITPEGSFQATYYDQEAYTEESSIFPDKQWDAYDQWSYLSALGLNISAIQKMDLFSLEFEVQPELRIHWLHEFNNDMDQSTYAMVGGASEISVALQAREEDLLKIGAGVRFAKWNSDALEFSLDVDATVGQDYQAIIGSGRVMHRF